MYGVCRANYPSSLQFSVLCRFVIDQTQSPSIKAKLAILQYAQRVIESMQSSEFAPTPETKLAVSRVVTWSTEPRSAPVREQARLVIFALFDLNSTEFSHMLWTLPKPFQVRDFIFQIFEIAFCFPEITHLLQSYNHT